MAFKENVQLIPLTGAGTEIPTLNISTPFRSYAITGTAIAIGNYAIVPTGSPILGDVFFFNYVATLDITTNGTSFSVFGVALTQNQLTSKLEIRCTYIGSSWKVDVSGSLDEDIIDTTNIVNDAITTPKILNHAVTNIKLATGTPSSVKIADASGLIQDLALANDELAIGNGTTIVPITATALLASAACCLSTATITVPSGQVRLLNTTPLQIVAPVVGKYAVAVTGVVEIIYNSIPYATNTIIQLITDTATNFQLSNSVLDAAQSASYLLAGGGTPGGATTQLIANKGLYVKVPGGNPTTGDSAIRVTVFYKLI